MNSMKELFGGLNSPTIKCLCSLCLKCIYSPHFPSELRWVQQSSAWVQCDYSPCCIPRVGVPFRQHAKQTRPIHRLGRRFNIDRGLYRGLSQQSFHDRAAGYDKLTGTVRYGMVLSSTICIINSAHSCNQVKVMHCTNRLIFYPLTPH